MNEMELVVSLFGIAAITVILLRVFTRPELGEMMSAWAAKHSEDARNANAQSWIEGYEAGQEYERIRGGAHE